MKHIFNIIVCLTLVIFVGEKAMAQQHACYLQLDGLPTDCTLASPSDISIVFSKTKSDNTVVSVSTEAANPDDRISDWGDLDIATGLLQINLQELNVKSALGAGDKLSISVKIKSSSPCMAGASGTVDFTYDGSGFANTDGFAAHVLMQETKNPKISISDISICAGTTGTLTLTITDGPADMTGYTIAWGDSHISTSGAITSTGAQGSVSSTLTSSLTGIKAQLKDPGSNVVDEVTYNVTVNPKPTLGTASASPSTTTVGNSSQLSVANPNPADATLTWSGTGPLASTSGTPVSTGNFTAAGTYTYQVQAEKNTCKSDPKSVTVTVAEPLKVTPTGGGAFCQSSFPKTLNAGDTGGAGVNTTYTWSSTPGGLNLSSTSSKTPQVLASSAPGIYTVSVDVTKGGETKNGSVQVTVKESPKLQGTATATPNSITTGQSSTLSITGATPAGASLTWSGSPLAATSGASVSTGVINTANTYTYTVTAELDGCEDEQQVTLTVTAAGEPLKVNPTGGGSFCQADFPKTLNAGETGGSGTPSYEWTSTPAGLNLSSTSIQNPQVLASSAPNTYTVSVKVIKGQTVTGTLTVVVKQSPQLQGTATATPNSIAEGNSSTLSITGVNPNTATLTWSGGPLATTSGTSVSTGTINTAGTYNYKITADLNGCTNEKQVTLTVTGTTPPPAITITPPAGPITGNTNTPITGNVTVGGGDGNYTYDWSSKDPDVTITDNGNGSFTVTSPNPGTKEICVEVSSGGEKKKECFNVIVTDPATVNLVMTVDKKCAYPGEQLTITITGTGADTYSFILRDQSNNAVMTVTNQATWGTHKVLAAAAGTYKITDFKYKIAGVESTGTAPAPVTAMFDPIPNVYAMADHSTEVKNCQGDLLTLKGSGDTGVRYDWDHGVTDGVPFTPTTPGTYTVTATNLVTGCKNSSSVTVTINPKPTVVAPLPQEVCAGELVTLTATGTGADRFDWNNGIVNGQPFRANLTTEYEVTGTNTTTGCSAKANVTVTVNQPPHIVRTSKNPRNIAIGKDVYFALTATGKNLTYQWKKKENGAWVNMVDNTAATPVIIGTRTDSMSLLSVPKTWDGSEFRCVVTGDCGKDSTDFLLGVRECFTINTQLVMWEGIIPDENPGNKIDGWYCRGQKIALKAVITSEEGYVVENARYKWTIDGLDIPEEHLELVSDTAILTWIPAYTEDDIVIKVCAYCDGACEEVCPKYIRLKAREFDDVAMRIMTDRDPSHMFCPGDTVNFWIASKNAGEKPVYTWYNDVFKLPAEQSPRNKLLHYENEKVTLAMGQEDTWMRVMMTPSPEVCLREPVLVDTVFMKKKQWVEPSLSIFCLDTLVCKGDSVSMQAIYANAGSNPTFQWQRSIGDPFLDWNLGTKSTATVFVDEADVWVKCTMKPSEEVCYDMTKPLVAAKKILVLQADGEVLITCDMKDKRAGDELLFKSEVKNILGNHKYEWVVNERIDQSDEEDFISTTLRQGDIVYCMVSGERVCQKRVTSNEIVVDYGQMNRDTMLVIYKGETIKNLDMSKEGDQLGKVIFKIEIPALYGMATINPAGKFTYIPNSDFVGTDEVKYVIVNKADKTVIGEGYIYITVLESDRFFIPNLITPNGDGLNDTWKLNFLSEYPNHLIQVFDRNGKIVYETRNYQNDWGGEGMAKSGYVGHINLVNGIYTYIVDLGDKDKTILKSWLEIRANLNRRNYR